MENVIVKSVNLLRILAALLQFDESLYRTMRRKVVGYYYSEVEFSAYLVTVYGVSSDGGECCVDMGSS
jgi:hypothetical protein